MYVIQKRFVTAKHGIGSKRVGSPLSDKEYKHVCDLGRHMQRYRGPKYTWPNCPKAFKDKWCMQRYKTALKEIKCLKVSNNSGQTLQLL